jgi:hypothetical protein
MRLRETPEFGKGKTWPGRPKPPLKGWVTGCLSWLLFFVILVIALALYLFFTDHRNRRRWEGLFDSEPAQIPATRPSTGNGYLGLDGKPATSAEAFEQKARCFVCGKKADFSQTIVPPGGSPYDGYNFCSDECRWKFLEDHPEYKRR